MTEEEKVISQIEQIAPASSEKQDHSAVDQVQDDTQERIAEVRNTRDRELAEATVSTRVYMVEHLPIEKNSANGKRFAELKDNRKACKTLSVVEQKELEELDECVGIDFLKLDPKILTSLQQLFEHKDTLEILSPLAGAKAKQRVLDTIAFLEERFHIKRIPHKNAALYVEKSPEKADTHRKSGEQVSGLVEAIQQEIQVGSPKHGNVVFVGNKSFADDFGERSETLPSFFEKPDIELALVGEGYLMIDFDQTGNKAKRDSRILVTPANNEKVRTFLEQSLPGVGVDKDIVSTQNKLNEHLVTQKYDNPKKYKELLFTLQASDIPEFRSYALRTIFTMTEEPLSDKILDRITAVYETKKLSLLEQDMLLRLLTICRTQQQQNQIKKLIARLFIQFHQQLECPELLYNLFQHHGQQKWLKVLRHNLHTNNTILAIQGRSLDPEINQHVQNALLPRKWGVKKDNSVERPQPVSPKDYLQGSNTYVLEEPVGFGKSLWLGSFAQQLLVHHPDHSVVVIEACSLNDKNPEEAKRVIQTTIKQASRVGKPVVLIDALDELTSRLQPIQEFILALPYPKFITSRPGIIRKENDMSTEKRKKGSIKSIQLESLSVEEFIHLKGKDAEQRIRKFLEENPIDAEIQNSPLVLHMICLLAQGLPNINGDFGILPLDQLHDRSSLYENVLKLVIVEHEMGKGKEEIRNREQLEELFDYLSELALGITLGKSYAQIQKEQKWSANDKAALEKINILVKVQDNGSVQFTHESFREYFLYRYWLGKQNSDWGTVIMDTATAIPNELEEMGLYKTAQLVTGAYYSMLSKIRRQLMLAKAFNARSDFISATEPLIPTASGVVLQDICSVTGQLQDPDGIPLLQSIYARTLPDQPVSLLCEGSLLLPTIMANLEKLDLEPVLSSPDRAPLIAWLQQIPAHPDFYHFSVQLAYFNLADQLNLVDELLHVINLQAHKLDWANLFRAARKGSKQFARSIIHAFRLAPHADRENHSFLWNFLDLLSSQPEIPDILNILEDCIPLYNKLELKDSLKLRNAIANHETENYQTESVAEQFFIAISRLGKQIDIPASFLEKILAQTNNLTGHEDDSIDGFIMEAEKLDSATSFALLSRIFNRCLEFVTNYLTASLYIHALGKTHNPDAIELIDRLYQHMLPEQKEQCLWAYVRALGWVGGSKALTLLSRLEPPTQPYHVNLYISAIGNIGLPAGVPLLRNLARTPCETSEIHNTETVTILADALGRIPGQDAHLFLNDLERDITSHPLSHEIGHRSDVYKLVSAPADSMYYTFALAYVRHHDRPKSIQYLEKYLSYARTNFPHLNGACRSILKGTDPDFIQQKSHPGYTSLVDESRQTLLQTIQLLAGKHPREAALHYVQLEMFPEALACLRKNLEMAFAAYLQNKEYTSPFDQTLQSLARDEYFQSLHPSPEFQAMLTEFQDRFNAIPEEDKPAPPNMAWLGEEPFDFG